MLRDKNALGHFIQFMESCDSDHIIRFWLDAESFQATARLRIRTHSLNLMTKMSLGQCSTIGRTLDDHDVMDTLSNKKVVSNLPHCVQNDKCQSRLPSFVVSDDSDCVRNVYSNNSDANLSNDLAVRSLSNDKDDGSSDAKTVSDGTELVLDLKPESDPVTEKLRKGKAVLQKCCFCGHRKKNTRLYIN